MIRIAKGVRFSSESCTRREEEDIVERGGKRTGNMDLSDWPFDVPQRWSDAGKLDIESFPFR